MTVSCKLVMLLFFGYLGLRNGAGYGIYDTATALMTSGCMAASERTFRFVWRWGFLLFLVGSLGLRSGTEFREIFGIVDCMEFLILVSGYQLVHGSRLVSFVSLIVIDSGTSPNNVLFYLI